MNVRTGLVHAEAPLAHRLTCLRRRNGRYGAASKAQLILILCGKISLDLEKRNVSYPSLVDTIGKYPTLLRIRDVYPRSRIRIFSIPDPNFFHPGIKEF
jgi:hypothetical protein